jgi:hypothetical protein
MKNYFFGDWIDIRKKGFWRFVIIRGVIGWGWFVFTFSNLLSYLTSNAGGITYSSHWLFTQLAIWNTAGFLWGWAVWNIKERSFRLNKSTE